MLEPCFHKTKYPRWKVQNSMKHSVSWKISLKIFPFEVYSEYFQEVFWEKKLKLSFILRKWRVWKAFNQKVKHQSILHDFLGYFVIPINTLHFLEKIFSSFYWSIHGEHRGSGLHSLTFLIVLLKNPIQFWSSFVIWSS